MKKHTNDAADTAVNEPSVEEENAATAEKHDEYMDKYLRALADYQNLEKQTHKRIDDMRLYASEQIIRDVLTVADSFVRAQEHIKDKGLELSIKQLFDVLAKHGVLRIEVLNHEFDPMTMECIDVGEGEDNMVLSEIEAGYTLHGKVIRVAKVKVGKKTGNL